MRSFHQIVFILLGFVVAIAVGAAKIYNINNILCIMYVLVCKCKCVCVSINVRGSMSKKNVRTLIL